MPYSWIGQAMDAIFLVSQAMPGCHILGRPGYAWMPYSWIGLWMPYSWIGQAMDADRPGYRRHILG